MCRRRAAASAPSRPTRRRLIRTRAPTCSTAASASGPVLADSNVWSYASQAIDLSRFRVVGQRFLLSGYLGGLTTQSDYAEVVGPLRDGTREAHRAGCSIPDRPGDTGTTVEHDESRVPPIHRAVPWGAAKAVVTIATEQVGAGPRTTTGWPTTCNLTIGSSVPASAVTDARHPALFVPNREWRRPRQSAGLSPRPVATCTSPIRLTTTSPISTRFRHRPPVRPLRFSQDLSREMASRATVGQRHGRAGPTRRHTEDARGDVYIADTEDNVIRKVSAFTGTITRVAGQRRRGQCRVAWSGDKGRTRFARRGRGERTWATCSSPTHSTTESWRYSRRPTHPLRW